MPRRLVLLAAAAVLTASGCASKCGTNCPPTVVDIFATPGENLDVAAAPTWSGPACPSDPPRCRDDGVQPCAHFSFRAVAPGACDLTITFDNRPTFSAHATFGPDTHQGCCVGFPVLGQMSFTVPRLGSTPDGGADSQDSGSDASADTVD